MSTFLLVIGIMFLSASARGGWDWAGFFVIGLAALIAREALCKR